MPMSGGPTAMTSSVSQVPNAKPAGRVGMPPMRVHAFYSAKPRIDRIFRACFSLIRVARYGNFVNVLCIIRYIIHNTYNKKAYYVVTGTLD